MREKDIIKSALKISEPDKEKIRSACLKREQHILSIKRISVIAACFVMCIAIIAMIPMLKTNSNKELPYKQTEKQTDIDVTKESEEVDINIDLPVFSSDLTLPCEVHRDHFHTIPGEFLDYVGTDRFEEWAEVCNLKKDGEFVIDENGCCAGMNIVAFINYFDDIIQQRMIKLYYAEDCYFSEWDLELLLTRDEQKYEEYARQPITPEEEYRLELLRSEYRLKERIIDKMSEKTDQRTKEFYQMLTTTGDRDNISNFPIIYMVENTSLTLEDLESCAVIDRGNGYKNVEAHYVYNFDLLFDEKGAIREAINNIRDTHKPYESYPLLADALLHVGNTEGLYESGQAVELDEGIYIPEGKLPNNNDELENTKNDFVIYNGRVYWFTELIPATEDEKFQFVDKYLGETKKDLCEARDDWEMYNYYDFSSTIGGDVYSAKGYDKAFRIIIPNLHEDYPYVAVFESNRGVLLNMGYDLFGAYALNIAGSIEKIMHADEHFNVKSEITDIPAYELAYELIEGFFCMDEGDLSNLERVNLCLKLNDKSSADITVYENGYVEYKHLKGYNVYLKIGNSELVEKLF